MEATFMNTRKRVEILVDILSNQVSLLLPSSDREEFVAESHRRIDLFFRTTGGKRLLDERRDALGELLAIEKAVFHITGKMREWLNENCKPGDDHGG